jgi:Co/Zn/Cd efflux system component
VTVRDFAYGLLLGKPIVVWLGILALMLLLSAAAVMFLTLHARKKIPFGWHKRFAVAGIIVALIHMVLALSAYVELGI